MSSQKALQSDSSALNQLGSKESWYTKESGDILEHFNTTQNGLSHNEAYERTSQYGLNRFTDHKQDRFTDRLIEQFKSPLVIVLVLAALVTFSLHEYVDAGVIAFALLIAVAVGLVQEGKASKAFQKLASSQDHIAFVFRDGAKVQVDATTLVPGDIVELQGGMQVPADVRLFFTKKLSINESPLTGEWLAVNKQPDTLPPDTSFAEQTNMAWKGTFVAEGIGRGVVVATGDKTVVGVLAENVQLVEEEDTPLQVEMKRVSKIMLYLILALVTLIFFIGLIEGQSLEEMLLMSIAIAVASVPEGLPAAVTIILAVGMEALLKRGGLVRNLLAAETLGSTTYVLTDKTGTLTEGKMAVTGVLVDCRLNDETSEWRDRESVRDLFNIALCASDAFLDKTANIVRGDPVEAAILHVGERLVMIEESESYRAKRLDFLPFSSEQRFAAGLAPADDGNILCVNGAPKHILEHCTHHRTSQGIAELTPEARKACEDAISRETSQGKRLVASAFKQYDSDDIPDDGSGVLGGLVFSGVLVFTDPVRDGVKEAIEGVRSAGAEILLITGDNPQTALSVAQKVGIVKAGALALTGKELGTMSNEQIEAALKDGIRVFARVLPQQKLRIAQLLQRRGEIVAMTGDGINDAPALRKANIGVAIGSGTEVAKESSDLVLVNDTFATIYAAIEEGRRIISNLRKIVGYLLATSLSEVVLIGAALLTGAPAPITAVQILWANVIEEGFMSVAFAFEKGEKGAMQRKPHDIHAEGILSTKMLWFMAFVVSVLSVLTLSLYFYLRSINVPFEELRSAMFLSIAIDSLFIAFSFRSLTTPIWNIPLQTNLFFIGSFLLSAVMFVGALSFPLTREFLSYTPLPLFDIILIAGVSIAALMTIETGKWIFFEREK